jgi:hypothetical protein
VRIYRSQVPRLGEEIVDTLILEGDIEVEPQNREEAILDVRSILDEYLRQETKVVQDVRDYMHERQITYDKFGKVKGQLADERGHPTGDDGIRWIIGQIIEAFMISNHVEEVFSEDFLMRRKMMILFRRILVDEADLDKEARSRIKNVREGTDDWEFEYKKAIEEIKRKKGLEA